MTTDSNIAIKVSVNICLNSSICLMELLKKLIESFLVSPSRILLLGVRNGCDSSIIISKLLSLCHLN